MDDETKPPQSAYSGERIEITGPNSLRGATATAEAEKSGKPESLSDEKQNAVKPESAQTAPKEKSSPETPVASLPLKVSATNTAPAIATTGEYSPFADLFGYLERTKYMWLGLLIAVIAYMAVTSVMKGRAERERVALLNRHETAAATITPENLLARCGPAVEDVTKQMFPMVMRTMSYRSQDYQKIVFEFSRTAEEKSDWVFLSMKDETGAKSYETPEAKVAALPCLDLRK